METMLPRRKPPNPGRPEIKPQVDHVLNSAREQAGNPALPEPIDDKKNLEDDLCLGPRTKQGLATSYTAIALQYLGGLPISLSAAANCDTVGNAIDLVHRRACGKH